MDTTLHRQNPDWGQWMQFLNSSSFPCSSSLDDPIDSGTTMGEASCQPFLPEPSLSIPGMILQDHLESQLPPGTGEWLLHLPMSSVSSVLVSPTGQKDPYIGQLIAPASPAIAMADPVLQQIQNLNESADIPYGQLRNSMVERCSRQTKPKRQRNMGLIKIVHSTMLDLIGVKKARGANADRILTLPHPLRNGEITRIAPNGTKLWNPNWQEDGLSNWNTPYLESVVNRIIDSYKENTMPDDDEIFHAVRQYYTTLQKSYKAQTTAVGQAQHQRKNTGTTRRQRRRAKCTERMKQVAPFRLAYGEECTVGLEDLIKTEYMSSEHSDAGAIDELEYTQHRVQQGGDNAFEIRREMWRSEQLNRIYTRLQTFSDEDKASRENRVGRRARVGKIPYTRYQGLHGNANYRCPPSTGRHTPYSSLVSQSWAHATGNIKFLDSLDDDPPGCTIMSLGIPNSHIDSKYWDYLADDEAEVPDPSRLPDILREYQENDTELM